MQFTIVGAGALGTILGGHLLAAGHGVTMIARGARLQQIKTQGLRLSGLKPMIVPCVAVDPGTPIAEPGIVIFTVKTYQMSAALAALAQLRPAAVFSVANGVLKNEQLAAAYGTEVVLGCMANVSGELLPSGTVDFTRNVHMLLGALAGYCGPDPLAIAAIIDAAGVVTSAVTDIETVEWSKFVGWLAMFTLSVIARATTGVLLEHPRLAAVGVGIVREAAAIAAARGIALVDQSPIPVVTVSTAPLPAAVQKLRDIGRHLLVQAPSHRMSSLQDLAAGRVLEVDETLGYAVSEAARLGLAVPTLALCYDLVAGLNDVARAGALSPQP